MRDYAKIAPSFWMTGTGKALRGCLEAQVVGLYLLSCPNANMLGLYYLPMALLVHETGLSTEGARKGLTRASEAGFAMYDESAELVWVPNAAAYQIADRLTGKDKRKGGVLKDLFAFRKHPFSVMFFDRYCKAFELSRPDWLMSPSEGAWEPLRSQEQEQEQEQEQQGSCVSDLGSSTSLPSQPSQDLHSGVRRAANATADGAFGLTVDSWAGGIRSVTGQPYPRPSGKTAGRLAEALKAEMGPDYLGDHCEHAFEAGAAYARANPGRTLDVFDYERWVGSGRPDRSGGTKPTLAFAPRDHARAAEHEAILRDVEARARGEKAS